MKQHIFVTALPNGLVENSEKPGMIDSSAPQKTGVSLSVKKPGIAQADSSRTCRAAVAFSLQVEEIETTLANVPDMLSWAERIRQASYKVLLDGQEIPCDVISPPIDTHLWANLFRSTVKVKAFEMEDLSSKPIASYPIRHVLEHIRKLTASIGSDYSNDLPDADSYTGREDFAALSDYSVNKLPVNPREPATMEKLINDKRAGQHVKDRLKKNSTIPFSPNPSPTSDFAQLKNFHGIYDFQKGKVFQQVAPPDFEFHDILSILSAYPQLLRRLGLVVDIQFEVPGGSSTRMKRKDAWSNTLRVIPNGVNFEQPATFVCAATAYKLTSKEFYPAPADSAVQDLGHLKLNTDAFTIFQLDTDGSALKLCQQSDALMLKKARHIFYASESKLTHEAMIPLLNNETPRKEALPSLRTAGIGVARNGAATVLQQRLATMKQRRNQLWMPLPTLPSGLTGNKSNWVLSDAKLQAEDVNIGFRMDVQTEDHPGKWFSLHKRNNQYAYLNASGDAVPLPDFGADEGYIQTSVAEEQTEKGPQLKLGEAIARWEGWSLTVPRPGSALNDPKLTPEEIHDKRSLDAAAKERAKYQTPGSADFRLNVHASTVKGSLPMLRFGKHYKIRLRTVDLAGNSVALETDPENPQDAVVQNIRYLRYEPVDAPFLLLGHPVRDGESAEHLVIRSNEGLSVGEYEKTHIDSKHSKPHGDISVRHVTPPRTTVEMATTHGMLDAGFGPDAQTRALDIYRKITQDKDPEVTQAAASPLMKIQEGNGPLPVAYLADPMAAGVCFYLSAEDPNPKLPDPEIMTRRVSFYFDDEVKDENTANKEADYATWMEPKTFRIVLREGSPDVKWVPKTRMLEVTLQKGAMVKINYACFWRPKELQRLSGALEILGLTSHRSTVHWENESRGGNTGFSLHGARSRWYTRPSNRFVRSLANPTRSSTS